MNPFYLGHLIEICFTLSIAYKYSVFVLILKRSEVSNQPEELKYCVDGFSFYFASFEKRHNIVYKVPFTRYFIWNRIRFPSVTERTLTRPHTHEEKKNPDHIHPLSWIRLIILIIFLSFFVLMSFRFMLMMQIWPPEKKNIECKAYYICIRLCRLSMYVMPLSYDVVGVSISNFHLYSSISSFTGFFIIVIDWYRIYSRHTNTHTPNANVNREPNEYFSMIQNYQRKTMTSRWKNSLALIILLGILFGNYSSLHICIIISRIKMKAKIKTKVVNAKM